MLSNKNNNINKLLVKHTWILILATLVELSIENIFFEVCHGVCVSAKARRLLKIIMENAKLNEENWQLGGVEG